MHSMLKATVVFKVFFKRSSRRFVLKTVCRSPRLRSFDLSAPPPPPKAVHAQPRVESQGSNKRLNTYVVTNLDEDTAT